jgi:Flp pilus assembly protein TadD
MKEVSTISNSVEVRRFSIAASMPASLALPSMLREETSALLLRMFRDPRVLEPSERRDLIAQLRTAVELEPHIPEIRVLLGMALSVDLQAQEALEQLRDASRQAPDSFIARLKLGELLMRLRICSEAAEETHKAAQLATNDFQADLARKQAAVIRTMLREGIERGGYTNLLSKLIPFRRRSIKTETAVLAGSR